MKDLLNTLTEFNEISSFARLIIAAIIGGLIGNERGKHGRAAGLRTHILICVGAAMTALIGLGLYEKFGQGDISRISAQVISGIGFLGAGTILVRNNSTITGLTTSAGLWATAAIGIAVGYGFYQMALASTIICLFSFVFLNKVERKAKNANRIYIEIQKGPFANRNANALLAKIKTLDPAATCVLVPAKSEIQENIGIICSTAVKTSDLKDALFCEAFVSIVADNVSI